ncbi:MULTISPECIES: type I-C CRISPR-associated protein Cas8c/Csd1 [Oscillospiraceae]|uniref:type I-C CRISPR-associated protein Cas8c/Csd1 n=1 Tax=Clostridia TaxID=186801 RepID=UPI000B3A1F39|nr:MULTISPECIES: type I-C CRISPR-associated protein Cas8c/Csd1 [Oscillospiraceae]OUQ45032.1 type I-C CRISPR-associated protein Cas8c/Csd1 [Drancourtella sp. An12]
MILQALVNYYEDLLEQGKVDQEGWCKAKVSYAINLSKEGKITGILTLKKEEPRGKKTVLAPIMIKVPEMVTRSSGISANFLCDNSKYLLGIDAEGTNQRIEDCFEAAKERHLSLLQGVEGEMAEAVRRFFETWDPKEAKNCNEVQERWEDITDGGNLIFCMEAIRHAQDDPAIAEAWEQSREKLSKDVETGVCLVTGKRSGISRIHKTIKGVPGAQSSGAALVSFNAPAFESYGKEQSYNAPVGRYAEFAYTTALNYLLSQREGRFQLGDSMIVYWAESGKKQYQDAFAYLLDQKPENQNEIRDIFKNLKENKQVDVGGIRLNPEQKFYILALAPNAARLSVRFFYENTFGTILSHLAVHYERMNVVKPSWVTHGYMGIRDMLAETVNQKSKDKSPVPNMAAMTLQAILAGTKYPASLYTDVLIRIRAEQGNVTWGRAGIIKAYLILNYCWKEGEKYMGLNAESQEVAYQLGRLFSVLESIQMDTNQGIKSTIRDRYFNSACATPASVFPVLIKLKNSHMKKLEREKSSAKIYYEKLLTEIMGNMTEFPRRLSLEEQGKFILGYYHQVQKKYEKREDK